MRKGKVTALAICLSGLLTLAFPPKLAAQQQLGLFQFYPLHGEIGYLQENQSDTTEDGLGSSTVKRKRDELQLTLREKMIFYNHRLMEIDLMGGYELKKEKTSDGESDLSLTKYDISLNFLKTHPYNAQVYSSKTDSKSEQSPTYFGTGESRINGGRVSLLEKMGLPIPITFSFNKSETSSSNLSRDPRKGDFITNYGSTKKTSKVSSAKNWGAVSLSLAYQEQDNFRFTEYPTERVDYSFETKELDTVLSGRVGKNDRWRWRLSHNDDQQSDWPKFESQTNEGESRFRLVENNYNSLDSLLGYSKSDQSNYGNVAESLTNLPSTVQTTQERAQLSHVLFRSLVTTANIARTTTIYPGLNSNAISREVGTHYNKILPNGDMSLQYSMRTYTSHLEGEVQQNVTDEPHVLVDFEPEPLAQENIDLNSVIVRDSSGQYVFEPFYDYRVYQLGTQTFIERVPGTAIINGDTVLISYAYITPTGILEERSNRYRISTRMWFLSPYYGVTETNRDQSDGTTTEPLERAKSTVAGITLNHSFVGGLTPSYNIEKEDNISLIYPYQRESQRVMIIARITANLTAQANMDRSEVDVGNPLYPDTKQSSDGLSGRGTLGRYTLRLGVANSTSIVGTSTTESKVNYTDLTIRYGDWILNSLFRTGKEQYTYPVGEGGQLDRSSQLVVVGLKRVF